MATPGTFSDPMCHIDDLKEPKLELACEEGHDANIPSNFGLCKPSTADPEKGTSSHPSTASGEDTVVAKVDPEAQHPVDEQDPNIVWWDGPNDPQNPMNWSMALKWGNIAALSGITFIT